MDIVTDGPTLVLSGDFDVRSTWEVRNAIHERLARLRAGRRRRPDERDPIDVTATRVLAYASREAGLSGTTSRCAAAARPSAGCCTSRT